MRLKPIMKMGLLLILLVAACAPAATAVVPTDTVVPPADTAAPVIPSDTPEPVAAFPTPTVEVAAAAGDDQGALAADGPSHVDAPAAPDEFRFDSAELVGATGSPQLVEFFTTW
jgi:hypothetical protein